MTNMKKQPQRKCVGCRDMKDKFTLVRVSKSENRPAIDYTGKAQGRGAYVCKNTACVEKAQKSKGLERSLKCALSQDIYESLKTCM